MNLVTLWHCRSPHRFTSNIIIIIIRVPTWRTWQISSWENVFIVRLSSIVWWLIWTMELRWRIFIKEEIYNIVIEKNILVWWPQLMDYGYLTCDCVLWRPTANVCYSYLYDWHLNLRGVNFRNGKMFSDSRKWFYCIFTDENVCSVL